jgi:transcription elongation factor Elf1
MSRNDDRLGLTHSPDMDDSMAAPAAAANGGGFSWSVPTEFVELPSEGKFYPPGHPAHQQSTIEIRYMTAKEEDILTSRSLLKKGVALDRMLQNILVNKAIDINSLLIGDKNALLVAARRTGYGPEYETVVTCPSCGNTQEYSFDISDPPINNYQQEVKEYQAVFTDEGNIQLLLPMTGVTLECRLLTGQDEVAIYKEAERKSKKKMESSVTTDAFRSYIVAVNGERDPFSIESFIHAMPARDARHLRQMYSKVVPNIDLTQHFECSNCDHETDMEVPLGVDFFWPK